MVGSCVLGTPWPPQQVTYVVSRASENWAPEFLRRNAPPQLGTWVHHLQSEQTLGLKNLVQNEFDDNNGNTDYVLVHEYILSPSQSSFKLTLLGFA